MPVGVPGWIFTVLALSALFVVGWKLDRAMFPRRKTRWSGTGWGGRDGEEPA
ncbi:hypothetical protein DYI95_009855 [Thermaerobacter sp. PB12/4term]|uniref:hypothetical protein n=1 Tax=Thermaerobacter sp. PB12/4term TaxID=2293838 RepID=UPI001313F9BD|nr:hypothetical protein [Thermaerobacter sp. PB12/4term]QIA27773.1 hypothetical protein DYI95_009855 [Thermaerobacter sp. PB12/4term]